MRLLKVGKILSLFALLYMVGIYAFVDNAHAANILDSAVNNGWINGYNVTADGWFGSGASVTSNSGQTYGVGYSGDSGACGLTHPINCLAQLLYFLLYVLSFVVSWVGGIFDLVFLFTVRNIKETIGGEQLTVIRTTWTVVRDLCNIFFIFILLWLAISTILGLNEHGVKHALSSLIVAAVLINFSLLFTQFVIDIPNQISVVIYDKVTNGGVGLDGSSHGLGSAAFSVVSPERAAEGLGVQALRGSNSQTDAQAFASRGIGTAITTFVMMIVLYTTVLFVFLAVVIIFIKRFIILVFLMIFSPLAFLGMALPVHSLQHEAQQKFWGTLFKESFYAPIFLLCFYVTIVLGQQIYGVASEITIIGTIFGFAVVIIMMVASLVIAEEVGVSGAGGAMTAFQGMSSWVQSNTIGRLAGTLINKQDGVLGHSDTLARWANGGARGGALTRNAAKYFARGVIKAGQGSSKGFNEAVAREQEYMEAEIEEAHGDPKAIAAIFARYAGNLKSSKRLQALDKLEHGLSESMSANVELHLQDMLKESKEGSVEHKGAEAAINRYHTIHDYGGGALGYGRMSPEKWNKVQRAKLGALEYYNDRFRKYVDDGKADNITSFIENAKSEGQVVGAFNAMGESAMKKMTENSTLSESLRRAVRNRFGGESFTSAISKSDLLTPEMKKVIMDPLHDQRMTYEYYEAFTHKNNDIRNAALNNKDVIKRFLKKIGDIDNQVVKDAIKNFEDTHSETGTNKEFEVLLDTYHREIGALDELSKNYGRNANGFRSMTRSANAAKEIEEMQDILTDVYSVGGEKLAYKIPGS